MLFDTGTLSKLTIAPCNVNDGYPSLMPVPTVFEAMLNPAGYQRNFSICYSEDETLGKSFSPPRFKGIGTEGLTISNLILDGTGVVPPVGLLPHVRVSDAVSHLLSIIYAYNGDTHEPNYVQILWGSFLFHGRLLNSSIDYTMFAPSGEPLRAKVTMTFAAWASETEISMRAYRRSPDLSHLVQVAQGDTLPLLCQRIYKNPAYYREIARINNLSDFRNLQAGTVLRFPPLI